MQTAHYPSETPVQAYGNGGFRFGEMSHKGSLLFLPSGVFGWHPSTADHLQISDFATVLEQLRPPGVLLLGTGASQIFPADDIERAFADAGIGLEPMTTGAAARTYNVLLAEKRLVAAALIAVP